MWLLHSQFGQINENVDPFINQYMISVGIFRSTPHFLYCMFLNEEYKYILIFIENINRWLKYDNKTSNINIVWLYIHIQYSYLVNIKTNSSNHSRRIWSLKNKILLKLMYYSMGMLLMCKLLTSIIRCFT